nr:unnamed protein product [Spirometra erinaceieuropaei]
MGITAFSEISFSEQGQLEEVGIGYTILWNDNVGRPPSGAGYQRLSHDPEAAFTGSQLRHCCRRGRPPNDQLRSREE